MVTSKIVEAVGVAAMAPGRPDLATAIEQAMSKAVLACAEEGVSDPVVIRERMMAARVAAKAAAADPRGG